MENIYYKPPNPAAYTTIDKLKQESQRPRKKVINWLEHQDTYNLHKLVRKRFLRRFYNVRNRDDVWEIDVADLKSIKTYYDSYSYLLIVIDALSKLIWIKPTLDKSGNSITEAFERILKKSNGRVPLLV